MKTIKTTEAVNSKGITATTKTFVSNKVKYEVSDEKYNFNTQTELNPDATLREIKEKIGSTRGYKKTPRTGYLRCCEDIVAATTAGDCRMEVYSNGFAIYKIPGTAVVIRMEYVGKVRYDGDPAIELGTQNIDLMDESWKIAVLLCAEARLERWAGERDAKFLVPWSEAGEVDEETGEASDLEVDAGVDIEEEFLAREAQEDVLTTLTQHQRECSFMHYTMGMTDREIATVLGIEHQNVNKALQAAIRKAKKILKNF